MCGHAGIYDRAQTLLRGACKGCKAQTLRRTCRMTSEARLNCEPNIQQRVIDAFDVLLPDPSVDL